MELTPGAIAAPAGDPDRRDWSGLAGVVAHLQSDPEGWDRLRDDLMTNDFSRASSSDD